MLDLFMRSFVLYSYYVARLLVTYLHYMSYNRAYLFRFIFGLNYI